MLAIGTWSRRRKIVGGVLGFTLAVVAGIALALIMLRAPLTGGGSVNQPARLEIFSAQVMDQRDVQCTTPTGNGEVRLDNAVAGSALCDVQWSVRRQGGDSTPLVIQDVRFSDSTVEGFYPVSALATGSCGVVLPESGNSLTIRVQFKVPADAPTGAFTALGDAGVYAVDQASYSDAACPRAS
jgi:hypothetical protein